MLPDSAEGICKKPQDEILKSMEKPLMVSPEKHIATCWGALRRDNLNPRCNKENDSLIKLLGW